MSTPNTTSEYMILFRGACWDTGLSPEETQRLMNQVMAWLEDLKTRGIVKAGQPLGTEGRTISGGKGRTAVSDGPFAEAKEAVGGYLLLEAGSIDEVVAIAKTNPSLQYGVTIEVRPVLEECPTFERARKQLLSSVAA